MLRNKLLFVIPHILPKNNQSPLTSLYFFEALEVWVGGFSLGFSVSMKSTWTQSVCMVITQMLKCGAAAHTVVDVRGLHFQLRVSLCTSWLRKKHFALLALLVNSLYVS